MDAQSNASSAPAALLGRWARAVEGNVEALRELAASYWYGVYVWWRRAGLDAEQAAAATVASFTRWIGTAPPGAEDSGAGLMRQWMPARLQELAAGEWEEEGEPAIAVDAQWAEERYADEPEGEVAAVFDRRWALTLLEFAMQGLRTEYTTRGLGVLFAEASIFVGFEGADEEHYAPAAERLGMTLGAMKLAIFELRKRHRELLRTYVADTVVDPEEVDNEITALLCACDLAGDPGANTAALPTAIRTFKPDELLMRAMNSVRMSSAGIGGHWKPPSDAEVARLFPQYEMRGLVGRGAMGAVYRAHQVTLDRDVAIKLLPLEVSVDRAFADRFVREARAMAKLSHPNIISVYNFGTTDEGHLFFVMEFVEGSDLSQILRGDGFTADRALAIVGQVCMALAYAHGKGVIHRDIKPANVMVNTDGVVKVADFGLARLSGVGAEQAGRTVTGTVLGTEEYMAPEQRHGTAVDHRADIFSMGVMLYEMLCKEPPLGAFEPPSERVGCDARIDQIVLKAMQRMPEDRFQTATEMKVALDVSRAPLPTSMQRRQPAPAMDARVNRPRYVPPPQKSHAGMIVGLVFAVLLAAVAVFILKANRKPDAKPVAQFSKSEPSAPRSTPVPDIPSKINAAGATAAGETATTPKVDAPISEQPAKSSAPKSAMEQWLADVDGPQQEAFQKQVIVPFDAGMEELRKSYLAALDAGQAKASSTGKLEAAIIWNDERRAFEESGQVELDDDTTPAPLLPLRAAFRKKLAQLESDRSNRAKPLHAAYEAILTKNITLLTQRNRIADALLLKNKRDEIARTWLATSLAERPQIWTDLLAPLTPAFVEQTGDGWSMKDGALYSSSKKFAIIPLFGNFARTSYRVHLKVRQISPKDVLHVVLPVGDRMVGFELDGWYNRYTGLSAVNGKAGKDLPGVVQGKQIRDSARHDLEITVRLDGANVKITTTLDARPLYVWAGPISDLNPHPNWPATPVGSVGLGSRADDWVVSEVKVRQLEIGWEDLLARLTPAVVEQTGHGWRMEAGALLSGDGRFSTVPLPGAFSGTSYQLRLKLRRLAGQDVLHVVLPVGDRMTGFELDGWYSTYTGINTANGRQGKDLPGVTEGRQVKDSEVHDMEITVRLDGANASITTTLDTRPLYAWNGLANALNQDGVWATSPPGSIALGGLTAGWVLSGIKAKRLAEPNFGIGEWEDLFAKLTPAFVEQGGQGWRLDAGTLYSPADRKTAMQLPGTFSGASYQVRVTVRQLAEKDVFHLVLPVGDRMAGFELDGFPDLGRYSGLIRVDGRMAGDIPGVVKGKQIKDFKPHELEVTVRLDGANARVTAVLDARPFYSWTGPISSLSQWPAWEISPPGSLALGTVTDDWTVTGVKVKKRLQGK